VPLFPEIKLDQNSSRPVPREATTPIPVMTTLGFVCISPMEIFWKNLPAMMNIREAAGFSF
jgi:hypothetical protein